MNWKSTAISEVAKERIWKEHVENEKQNRIMFDTFTVNPARMASRSRPVTESISKRPKRFLDRDAALLAAMEGRGLFKLPSPPANPHATQPLSARTETAQATVVLPSLPGASPRAADMQPHPPAPMSPRQLKSSAGSGSFAEMFEQLHWSPTQKYSEPQTSTQVLGWHSSQLSPVDNKFHYPHRRCDITKFAEDLIVHGKRSGLPTASPTAGPGTPAKR